MVPHRGPYGSSALLPYEVALIEQVGLTVDEYKEFQQLAAAYKAERAPGYERIPDVRNEVATILAVTSLVIGVASTAAALLMKPKPPEAPGEREPTNFEGGDNVGKENFSPRYGFDSVQTLATLGKVIPLIFGHRNRIGLANHTNPTLNDRVTCGGIRIDTQLVWSALVSKGRTQELRIAALLGASRLGRIPDYEGYAIGTTKLESIPQERVHLAFNTDGRRPEPSQRWCKVYRESQLDLPENQPDDLLAVQVYDPRADASGWNLSTSGTFTPSTNRAFGLYNQIPNGTAWMRPYSNIIVPNNNSQDSDIGPIATDKSQDEQRLKLIKTLTAIPNGSGIYDPDDRNAWENGGIKVVEKDDSIFYKIDDDLYDDKAFGKDGAEDINQAIQRRREDTESVLEIGEVYQIGNFKAKLISITPNKPLQPGVPMRKVYEFKALEKGRYQIMPGYNSAAYRDSVSAGDSAITPWYSSLEEWTVENPPKDDLDNAAFGNNITAKCCLISAVDDAIVSNTRKCNVTEIGIKSTVYRRAQVPNVNTYPSREVCDEIADTGGRLELGNMSRYLPRYSFFRILVRKSGNAFGSPDDPQEPGQAGNEWQFLHGGIKFAVYGKTPEPQYNWIRIFHPVGETDAYEYRLNPVPGWMIAQNLESATDSERIWLLNGKRTYAFGSDRDGVDLWGGFSIVFGGEQVELTRQSFRIIEFDRGPIKLNNSPEGGTVVDLDKYDNGKPRPSGWIMEEERYTDPSQEVPTNFDIPRNKFVEKEAGYDGRTQYEWQAYWDDELLRSRNIDRNDSTAPFVYDRDGKRYVCGPRTTEGFQRPGIVRYKIQKWGQVDRPEPNVEVAKTPENASQLSGTGLTLRVYSYQDPFDPDDDTKNAAWWVIEDGGSGYKNGETAKFRIRGENVFIELTTGFVSGNGNLYDMAALSDFPQYEGESISCEDGPEHELAYCNQQILNYGAPPTYDDMAYCTMRLTAGRQMTQFSQLSAYVKRGLKVERLIPDSLAELFFPDPDDREEEYSTCLFPEIAYALLTDPKLGVGELVGRYQVKRSDMEIAAQFCAVNGFTWNGVLAERVNLREWIYTQASHNLLDFTVVGGRFSLKPALLYTADYRMDLLAAPDIKGLFTDGNCTDLTVTFLEPAERQLFQANVVWREEEGNGFPKTKTTMVRLSPTQINPGLPGGNQDNDPIEVFDLSDSVTNEAHAIYFAKYALRARQAIDHTVTFKTTANELVGIEPGDYIKVTSACTHKARWNNGSIGPDGQITSTETLGINPRILYWKGGETDVAEIDLIYASDSGRQRTSQTELWGSVFTLLRDVEADIRTYRVTSISYADDGMIDVSAAHSPLTAAGGLVLADWNEDDFEINTAI